MAKTAILMTCHNRRDLTVCCLKSLFDQHRLEQFDIEVFCVDDGSSDGTSDALKLLFPSVRVVAGSGDLYWCGGMRLAWQEALKETFDYFVWLNDDVVLMPNALSDLFSSYRLVRETHGAKILVCGSMYDPLTMKRSYGGAIIESGLVIPGCTPVEVDYFAGNLVLVPNEVVKIIGILDSKFTHGIGDYDYALRARKNGIRIFTATNYQGTCRANIGVAWHDPEKTLAERWAILHSPKGPHPLECLLFRLRYKPLKAPFTFARMYLRVLFPKIF